jgi:hypothetical protein
MDIKVSSTATPATEDPLYRYQLIFYISRNSTSTHYLDFGEWTPSLADSVGTVLPSAQPVRAVGRSF